MPILEERCDSEIAAPSANGPKQIWIVCRARNNQITRSGNQLSGEQVVTCCAVTTGKPTEASTQRKARDPDCGALAEDWRQAMLTGRQDQFLRCEARASPYSALAVVDAGAFQRRHVDDEAALTYAPRERTVAAASHRDQYVLLVGKLDAPLNILSTCASRDESGSLVGRGIPTKDAASDIVGRVAGKEQLPLEM